MDCEFIEDYWTWLYNQWNTGFANEFTWKYNKQEHPAKDSDKEEALAPEKGN